MPFFEFLKRAIKLNAEHESLNVSIHLNTTSRLRIDAQEHVQFVTWNIALPLLKFVVPVHDSGFRANDENAINLRFCVLVQSVEKSYQLQCLAKPHAVKRYDSSCDFIPVKSTYQ